MSSIPRHTSIRGTLSLTKPAMSPNPSRRGQLSSSGTRVHCNRLLNDEAIGDELADRLTGVGVGDFVHLIRIKPDLALAAADYGSGEALLSTEVDPDGNSIVSDGVDGLVTGVGFES